jgi:hypothetical protein
MKKQIITTLFNNGPMSTLELKNTIFDEKTDFTSVDFTLSMDKLEKSGSIRVSDTDVIGVDFVELVQ